MIKNRLLSIYKKFVHINLYQPGYIFLMIVLGAILATIPKYYQDQVTGYICDFELNPLEMFKSIFNLGHLLGYFMLGTALLVNFKKNKHYMALTIILCISVSMEALQMLSWSRRCRLTDITPNLIGFIIAIYALNKIYPKGDLK